MIERMCKSCGKTFQQFNSLQTICNLCAFNKYEKPRKPMKRIGKVTQTWIDTRKEWIRENPGDSGIWECYLQIDDRCPKLLNIDSLTLDHIESRGRNPKLRFIKGNLAPACSYCNEKKGSRSLEEVKNGR